MHEKVFPFHSRIVPSAEELAKYGDSPGLLRGLPGSRMGPDDGKEERVNARSNAKAPAPQSPWVCNVGIEAI